LLSGLKRRPCDGLGTPVPSGGMPGYESPLAHA